MGKDLGMTLTKQEELLYYIGYLSNLTFFPPKGISKLKHKKRIEIIIEQICKNYGLSDKKIVKLNEQVLSQINIVKIVANASKSLMVRQK